MSRLGPGVRVCAGLQIFALIAGCPGGEGNCPGGGTVRGEYVRAGKCPGANNLHS